MQEKSSPEFARRLRDALADCGLRASSLAEKAGVSKGYVSELLKGKKDDPSFDTCKKFADVLGCSPRWLLFGVLEGQQSDSIVREETAGYGEKRVTPPEPSVAEAFRLLRQALDMLEVIVRKESMK